jgi:hypothetical protein
MIDSYSWKEKTFMKNNMNAFLVRGCSSFFIMVHSSEQLLYLFAAQYKDTGEKFPI